MKNKGVLIGVAIFLLMIGTFTDMAIGSWWDKGASVLESLDKTTTQTPKISSVASVEDIGAAFKEALHIGAENVVKQLGNSDGFNADPAIHIPLPSQLNTVRNVLGKVGMSGMVDDLELKLNRAAEAATPKAKELFWQSISEMTFDDVMEIYNGPEDSATKYFQGKMSESLSTEMRPSIEQSLAEVGVVQAYDTMMGRYQEVPFVPNVKADLTEHVLAKGLDGIFYYLAKEEASIRENPVKQTTNLLKKVFGVVK